MIDAIWVLWSRPLLHYTKATTLSLLTRIRRGEIADRSDQSMHTSTIEREPYPIARKIGYAITGLVIALILGPVFVFGVYTLFTSLMRL